MKEMNRYIVKIHQIISDKQFDPWNFMFRSGLEKIFIWTKPTMVLFLKSQKAIKHSLQWPG